MNNVILIGFLGSDAETRTTRNNLTLTTLSLATRRNWKDRESGEGRSQTTWHRLVSFGPLAKFAATLSKGAHLQITGELSTRQYTTKDGATKSITEIRVQRINRLDRSAKQEVAA
jgi:single-strand DNA-binding protein